MIERDIQATRLIIDYRYGFALNLVLIEYVERRVIELLDALFMLTKCL